jgi:hypothetical protein
LDPSHAIRFNVKASGPGGCSKMQSRAAIEPICSRATRPPFQDLCSIQFRQGLRNILTSDSGSPCGESRSWYPRSKGISQHVLQDQEDGHATRFLNSLNQTTAPRYEIRSRDRLIAVGFKLAFGFGQFWGQGWGYSQEILLDSPSRPREASKRWYSGRLFY